MKTITKNTTLVKKLTEGNLKEDYAVGKNAHLIVVYIITADSDMIIAPSVHLVGVGSSATVIGLVKASAHAQIKISTLQYHKARMTTSNLLVKGILSDHSHLSYDGSITVDKSAQKTDAYQRNENLLMDTNTQATSSPALEILANDVRCTHGAVVKTIDENELWYLASRGIGKKESRAMIAGGFLTSAYSLIADEAQRLFVEERASELMEGTKS